MAGRRPPQQGGWGLRTVVGSGGEVPGVGPDWDIINAFEDDLYDLRRLCLSDGRRAWAYVCGPRCAALDGSWDPQYFTEHHLADYVRRCIAWRQRRYGPWG